MLIGEFRHNLDPKKRLAIPSKFRKELGNGAVLTKGLDGCLFIFSSKSWAPFAEMLGGLSIGKQDTRSFARLFLSGAVEVEFDSLGRILIPDNLKEYASFKKEVVIAGLFNRLEIWDEEKWNKYKNDLEKNSDKIAEKLGELGLI
ncbi:MAG TPA: division/cell wall cluster transcriptional repressor MraZ [Candidatus Paceibacterota bacterium]